MNDIREESQKIFDLIPQKQAKALKDHPWLLQKLKETYGELSNNELLYLGVNPNINPVCPKGKRKKFVDKKIGYRDFCGSGKSCQCYLEFARENRIVSVKNQTEEQKENRLEKFKNTMKEKYGVENPMKSKDLIEKRDETILKKYGVPNILLTEENQTKKNSKKAKEKRSRTLYDKYGVSHHKYIHLGPEVEKIIKSKDELKETILKNNSNTTKIITSLGIDRTSFLNHYNKSGLNTEVYLNRSSSIEITLIELIQKNKLTFIGNARKIIPPYEIDIFLPDYNLGFELHGLYWHAESQKPNQNYHQMKFIESEKQNIRLIQFFENEVNNKLNIIENMILHLSNNSKDKVGARKTNIFNIDPKLTKAFLNKNHIFGDTNLLGIRYGAFYNNNLVGVMTFQPKKDGYELTRYATNMSVPGLFSKILKKFISDYNPKWIQSFSDNRFSNGDLYQKIGFEHTRNLGPAYWYTDYLETFHRFNFRKKVLAKKFNLDIEGKTEFQLTKELGLDRIWDAGKKEWILKLR